MSCSTHTNKQLEHIDSLLLHEQIDSALYLINNTNKNKLTSTADSAYFYLLKTRVHYIKDIPISQNFIDYSINFYENEHDCTKLAPAYYYKGAILVFSQAHTSQALFFLKKAEELAKKINNKELLHNIYELISYVNSENEAYDVSLDYSFKCLSLANQIKDSCMIAYAYSYIADTYLELKQYYKALTYQKKALQLLPYVDKEGQSTLLANTSNIYLNLENTKAAKIYAQKATNIFPHYYTYYILGSIYSKAHFFKESNTFLELAQRMTTKKKMTEDIMRLQIFNNIQLGQKDKSLSLVDSIFNINDKLHLSNNKLKDIEFSYKQEEIQKTYQTRINILIICIILTIATSSIIGIYFKFKKEKSKRLIAQKQLLLCQYKERLQEMESMQIDNKKEITKIKNKMDMLSHNISQMVYQGKQKYTDIINGKNTILWSHQDFENFIEYYKLIDFVFIENMEETYEKLSAKQKFYLILAQPMQKPEKDIEDILGISHVSLRSIKSRINKKKQHQ